MCNAGADIVAIAHAEWINEVSGVASKDIHAVTDPKTDTKPGLNYYKPTSRARRVSTAMRVYNRMFLWMKDPLPHCDHPGPHAFKNGKEALATLRHEMRHATHEQSTVG